MNKTAAKEWLRKVYHDLKSAQILYEADHFTDSIGVDLQLGEQKIDVVFNIDKNRLIEQEAIRWGIEL
jgi:hypothetical protein